jgi:hypothetical protein
LTVPGNADWTGGRVTIETARGVKEITLRNNQVQF